MLLGRVTAADDAIHVCPLSGHTGKFEKYRENIIIQLGVKGKSSKSLQNLKYISCTGPGPGENL